MRGRRSTSPISSRMGNATTTSIAASSQAHTRREGVPCLLRNAETQMLVSSRTTGFTPPGFHFRTRRGDVGFDIRLSVTFGSPMNAAEQALEILPPFLFGINRKETDLPLAHPHPLKRFQHTILIYRPNH